MLDRTRAALLRLDEAGRAFADDTPHNERAEAKHVVTYPAGLAWLRRLVENR